ncbi:N-acetylmuramoyl-L-alanine amidase [Gracilibacillus caseinilyticus]|uniref:N-acetylmuramoyl-L-alanine amidase n=1 Tax=Gracilibacillus caseinilyticus TaxID=2932256 RepID=A0ABY4F195_9BACI|nr:N-acetylmuramoyl-L-alanine amidase [Gracilibacillus caseinilyticus]UOQ50451.1 N-acetylmuramoyl-L-alanine amidase [Gracilibacillus caseinilyticus]
MTRRAIILSLFFLFFLLPVSVSANDVYEVDADVLMVREGPSSDSDIIGKLKHGDRVSVFNESYGWYQTYFGGEKGWVASQYLVGTTDSNSENVDTNEEINITKENVRIRSGPGTNYRMIGSASLGDTYPLVETSGNWVKVELFSGNSGWIASWLTSKQTGSSSAESKDTVSNQSSDQAKGDLQGKTIILDPGHGGIDPGAIGMGGVFEKDLTLQVADDIATALRNAGAHVLLTRSDDRYVSLQQRVHISNAYNTDLFLSLHFNAMNSSAINGTSVHYYGEDSRQLAYQMQNDVSDHAGLTNRGVMQDGYYVLRNNQHQALLLELGFITNPHDLLTIQTQDYQVGLAKGITQGLVEYLQ